MTGHVRLLKMSWLIAHHKARKILMRRQELPEEAFISVKELQRLYGTGNRDGVLPIIAISFCWLTPAHPDPAGEQLAIVAAALECEREQYARANGDFLGFQEMGVFWDWGSIHQKDPTLFNQQETPEAKPEAEREAFIEELTAKKKFYGGAEYEASRTSEEKKSFSFALHETMDLWYAHQGTSVYLLTELPEGCATRKVGYSDSGWTTYERCSAEQIKKVYLFNAKWRLVLDLGAVDGGKTRREWPVGPDDFDVIVETKHFTNGADQHAVKNLYRRMSIKQLGGIEMLDFTGMHPPSVEEARRLGRCLSLCTSIRKLDLSSVGMDDGGVEGMLSEVRSGSLASLTVLNLGGNQIGDEGMEAFSSALSSGSLPALKEVVVEDAHEDHTQLVAACKPRGIRIVGFPSGYLYPQQPNR